MAADYDIAEVAAAALKLSGALETKRSGDAPDQPPPGDWSSGTMLKDALPAGPGMAKIFLNVGRSHKVRPGDVVGAIANEAGVPGRAIGAIDIYDDFTIVEVPNQDAARVVTMLQRTTLRGNRINPEDRKSVV